MKLRIEISDDHHAEDEVIIRCQSVNDTIRHLQAYVQNLAAPKLVFYKGEQALYISLDDILFFETEGEQVYAHTRTDAFRVRYRLYELEDTLSRVFVRVSKGTIVNTAHIYAIGRNLSTSSQIQFIGTHKHVYVSRHYNKILKERMQERGVKK